MNRIYVNEKWCLGCHLCEYYCAFANSGQQDMVKAFDFELIKDKPQLMAFSKTERDKILGGAAN